MEKKLKVGLIGAGAWGSNMLWAFKSNPYVEVVGIADLDEARAKEAAAKHDVPKTWTDYRKMIEEEELDIVSVVTPDFLHKQVALDCAAKKINMILEKPVATTMEDCNAIVDAVKSSGIKFMTNYFQRWIPRAAEAKNAIKGGDLGEIVTGEAKIDCSVAIHKNLLNWTASSSPIFFLMIHNIDMVRWLIDSEAVEVYAKSQRKFCKSIGIDTDDAVEAMVTFENGATILFTANWILQRSFISLNDHEIRIVGTKGIACIDLSDDNLKIFSDKENRGLLEYPAKAPMYVFDLHGELSGCVRESVAHFVNCVRNDVEPLVTLKDALEPTKIACAVAESLEKGCVVKL